MGMLSEADVDGQMLLLIEGCGVNGKSGDDQEGQQHAGEARRNARATVAESEQAGELPPGAAGEREPVDLACAAIAGEHDRFHPGESAEAFRAVVATITAEPVPSKRGVRIRDGANDIVDAAASCGELRGDPVAPRAITRPDAAAQREGTPIGKPNGFALVAEGRHAEHGSEALFRKDAGLIGHVAEEHRLMCDGGAILRPVQAGATRERVFYLSAGTDSRILSQRAEV